jgi:hypothetical protein
VVALKVPRQEAYVKSERMPLGAVSFKIPFFSSSALLLFVQLLKVFLEGTMCNFL